jgi:hypothetical protein
MLVHKFYCNEWFDWISKIVTNFIWDKFWKTNVYINKERAYLLLAAWKTAKPACFSSLLGRRAKPEFSPLILCPRGPAQEPQSRVPSLPGLAENRPHMSVASPFSPSWPSRTLTQSPPNQTRITRDFHPNWGVLALYKLEPSCHLSFLDQTISNHLHSSSCRRRNPRSHRRTQLDEHVTFLAAVSYSNSFIMTLRACGCPQFGSLGV